MEEEYGWIYARVHSAYTSVYYIYTHVYTYGQRERDWGGGRKPGCDERINTHGERMVTRSTVAAASVFNRAQILLTWFLYNLARCIVSFPAPPSAPAHPTLVLPFLLLEI